jgi:hypothetical protein
MGTQMRCACAGALTHTVVLLGGIVDRVYGDLAVLC